jgi:integrase
MLLRDFVDSYILLREDLSKKYVKTLHLTVKKFSATLGREATVEDLNPEAVNRHLVQLRTDGLASSTRKLYKTILCVLCNAARAQKLITEELSRYNTVKIRQDSKPTEGFSWEEASELIHRLENPLPRYRKWLSKKYRRNGICRGDFWVAYIRATWDSSHPKDLRSLRFDQIQEDGVVVRMREKTGNPICWRFSENTLRAIEKIKLPARELVFPLPGDERHFFGEAARIIKQAGGFPGHTLGGLRAGSGTDVFRRYGIEAGRTHLGHANESTFRKHYLISRVVPETLKSPKPI